MRAAELVTRIRRLVESYQARVPIAARVGLACAWAGLIWTLSSMPGGKAAPNPFYSHVMNLGHVVVFGVLAGLVILSCQGCTPRRGVVAVLIAIGYGVVDELHQGTVAGRDVSAWDICSDGLGACLAAFGLHWLLRCGRRAGVLFLVCLPLAAASVHMAAS